MSCVGMLMVNLDDLVETVFVSEQLAIPTSELRFRFSRSSGPGGQHVNRSETRVELLFDVAHSPSLTEEQRARILQRVAGYIDGEGELHVVSSATRSQLENRADALARFCALLAAALRRRKHRVPTRPSAAARETRLDGKRTRARVKPDAAEGRTRSRRLSFRDSIIGSTAFAQLGCENAAALSCIVVVVRHPSLQALIDIPKSFGAEDGIFNLTLFYNLQFGLEPRYDVPRVDARFHEGGVMVDSLTGARSTPAAPAHARSRQ